MKKLKLNSTSFAGAEVLSRKELRNVMGGFADVCQGQTGVDLENCKYNVCMAGWDASSHNQQANNNKIDSCTAP